jgi:hypothetical protein
MEIPRRNFFCLAIVVAASVVCALPVPTFAGEPAKKAAASPPDVGRKVYTNDDLGWPGAGPAATSAVQPAQATGATPAASAGGGVSAAKDAVQSEPLDPLHDPRWYARQTTPLEAELANITSRAQALRQFRSTAAGMPTGLVLEAPCEGIHTDNLIAQLDLRRKQILRQLEDLDDTAHRNGLQPGAVAEARALAQIHPPPTVEQQQFDSTGAYRQRADELAQTRAVIAAMQQHVAAQGMTLLMPVPGAGGNMTTDLLQRLDARANSLQSQLSAIEDDARRAGVQPGVLR